MKCSESFDEFLKDIYLLRLSFYKWSEAASYGRGEHPEHPAQGREAAGHTLEEQLPSREGQNDLPAIRQGANCNLFSHFESLV